MLVKNDWVHGAYSTNGAFIFLENCFGWASRPYISYIAMYLYEAEAAASQGVYTNSHDPI